METLVIGYGSIGQRHAKILKKLGCDVAIVSTRTVHLDDCYYDLPGALFHHKPKYVIVATRTGEHYRTLETLARNGYTGKVLIEKPLFDIVRAMPDNHFGFSAVAYNLRFHPLIIKLKNMFSTTNKLFTASVYVGSYLPNWRTSIDYRTSYSASKIQGGGVIRDLSHELDVVFWLFGPWTQLTATGGHFSDLEIDSDDAYSIIMNTKVCPLVSINMNYLDRIPRREIIVNTEKSTIHLDLIKNVLAVNDEKESATFDLHETYVAEHMAMIAGNGEYLCSIEDAMETLITIDAAETAALSKKWITRTNL